MWFAFDRVNSSMVRARAKLTEKLENFKPKEIFRTSSCAYTNTNFNFEKVFLFPHEVHQTNVNFFLDL